MEVSVEGLQSCGPCGAAGHPWPEPWVALFVGSLGERAVLLLDTPTHPWLTMFVLYVAAYARVRRSTDSTLKLWSTTQNECKRTVCHTFVLRLYRTLVASLAS